MSTENIKQGGIVAEQVEQAFKQGDTKKALDILEQNFGSVVKGFLENVMKYSNLTTNELGGIFGKISDFLERAAEKIAKNQKLQERLAKMKEINAENAEIAELAAVKQAAAERQERFEDRVNWYEEEKKKILEQKRKLEAQKKAEKDAIKRREIEKKLKEVENKRQKLEAERKKLAELKRQNASRDFTPSPSLRKQETQEATSEKSFVQSGQNPVFKQDAKTSAGR